MEGKDLIVGVHSIAEAIRNPERKIYQIVATEDGLAELRKRGGIDSKKLQDLPVKLVAPHKLQEDAKILYKEMDLNFNRVPSQIYLVCSEIETYDVTWVYERLEADKKLKVLCLDQVTDVHNGAAVMRTAAFYGVDCIVVAMKGNFGTGPSFARIASGATEFVNVVKCSSLPKFLTKIQKMGVTCVGFSEHATIEASEISKDEDLCLVMGAEDTGLSNAVERIINHRVAFKPQGQIKSLNVSVAAAIAMEKFFA
jgi:23S rRNA (guanosine2251-2'-O)-methyltransferase